MKITNNYRLLKISEEDIEKAQNEVKQKRNEKKINKEKEVYGKLAENISEYYLEKIINFIKFENKLLKQTENETIRASAFTNILLDYEFKNQDLGNKKSYKKTDFIIKNKQIEENLALTQEQKKNTEFKLEIKSKSTTILKKYNNEYYWNKYKTTPDILYAMKENDYNQLINHLNGYTLIWGLLLKEKEKNTKVIEEAYCYFFSNKEILSVLRENIEWNEVDKYEDYPVKFMKQQENLVWDKNKISNLINTKKAIINNTNIDLGEPIYRIIYELRLTELSNRPKYLIKEKNKKLETKTKENTRDSFRLEENVLAQIETEYPKQKILEKLENEKRTK